MKNKPGLGTRNSELGRKVYQIVRIGGKLPRFLWLAFILHPSFRILPSASAQQAVPPAHPVPTGPLTYESFRLLHLRNVFDPDRRPIRPTTITTNVATGRADYLALTGTLIDSDKSYAFFSGSRSDFNKVLTVRDKIANATITQITPLNIVVERTGKSVNVAVGQTVPLDDKSAPGPAPSNLVEVTATSIERPAAGTDDAPPASGTGSAASGTAAVAPPGVKPPAVSKEEIMRRMMEKRQQDLK